MVYRGATAFVSAVNCYFPESWEPSGELPSDISTLRPSFQSCNVIRWAKRHAQPGIGPRISQLCEMGLYGCLSRCQNRSMIHKKAKKELGDATYASVKREMAKPRVAKSARIAELNLNTRIPERPSTSMPGIVSKIIPSARESQPEKAQIAVDRTDHQYRDLRIENTLTDEHGDAVRLKKGAHVQVTVRAEAKT
jgi:hypothetical protein